MHQMNSHPDYSDAKFNPFHMKNIIQFWIIIEITIYFSSIIYIAFLLGMSSWFKLRLLKSIANE